MLSIHEALKRVEQNAANAARRNDESPQAAPLRRPNTGNDWALPGGGTGSFAWLSLPDVAAGPRAAILPDDAGETVADLSFSDVEPIAAQCPATTLDELEQLRERILAETAAEDGIDSPEGNDNAAAVIEESETPVATPIPVAEIAEDDDDPPEPAPKFSGTARLPDEFRSTASNILQRLPENKGTCLLLLGVDQTPPSGDTVAQIAQALAEQMDDPVLAIDAGGARLTHSLRVRCADALANVLAGRDTWQSRIVQTATPGLSLLASDDKPIAVAPAAMHELLEQIRPHFGLVVVDAGVCHGPSAEAAASACGNSVLLVRLGRTVRHQAQLARNKIASWGGTVLGTVVATYPAPAA